MKHTITTVVVTSGGREGTGNCTERAREASTVSSGV